MTRSAYGVLFGLMVGSCGGIGSTYNVMPHLYVKLWRAFQAKDMDAAVAVQLRVNERIRVLLTTDVLASVKQTLAWIGIDVGAPRAPGRPLTAEEAAQLKGSLQSVGFFDDLPAI